MIYRYKSDMGNNPASVDINNGIVYINKSMWDKLDDYEKVIILLHEEGHYKNKSVDEIKADCYMIGKYLSEADTPQRRQEITKTIFKIVPDQERKYLLCKHLLQYDAVNRRCVASEQLGEAIDGCMANFTVGTAVAIANIGLKIFNTGLAFWKTQKDKKTYWRYYESTRKDEIIHAAAKAAITNKFLSSGGDYAATMAAAKMPYSDTNSLWADTFAIIASGVKFDPANFDNRSNLTVGEASAIFWNNSGYGFQWMSDWVGYMKDELEEMWANMSFFGKVRYSTKYKLYLAGFAVLAFLVWKFA